MTHMVHHGDCIEVMRGMADGSIDAIVTDPPYGIRFMGKAWDGVDIEVRHAQRHAALSHDPGGGPNGGHKSRAAEAGKYDLAPEGMRAFQAFSATWSTEALRLLKPGGYLLSFASTRTYHRMVCGIEDAGFEVRDRIRFECSMGTKYGALWDSLSDDQRDGLLELLNEAGLGSELAWSFGSGFPKSRNGEWGGTALKPAYEPILVARKPLAGTVEANWKAHGTGALNIDACRIPTTGESLAGGHRSSASEGWDRPWKHDPSAVAAAMERGAAAVQKAEALGRWPANVLHDGSDEVVQAFPEAAGQQAPIKGTEPTSSGFSGNVYGGPGQQGRLPIDRRDGGGSAARFFYCAKASSEDRNEGAENTHPTVKPTELMRYLCRLVTPPGGIVLDPFTGSGTTGRAAVLEGFSFVGIELDADYIAIARARIEYAARQGFQPSLLEAA